MRKPNPSSKAQSMIATHQGKTNALVQAKQVLYMSKDFPYWEKVINEINNYEPWRIKQTTYREILQK